MISFFSILRHTRTHRTRSKNAHRITKFATEIMTRFGFIMLWKLTVQCVFVRFAGSFACSPVRSLVRLFVRSFARSPVRSFVRSFRRERERKSVCVFRQSEYYVKRELTLNERNEMKEKRKIIIHFSCDCNFQANYIYIASHRIASHSVFDFHLFFDSLLHSLFVCKQQRRRRRSRRLTMFAAVVAVSASFRTDLLCRVP